MPEDGLDSTDSPRRKAASKVMRKWGDSSITESDMAALDFSSPAPATSSSTGASTPSKAQLAELVSQEAMGSRGKDGLYDVADLDTGGEVAGEEDEEDDMIARALEKGRLRTKAKAGGALAPDVESEVASGVAGGMSSWFGRLTGSKSLDKEDLKPVLEAMEKHLMSKNVAKGISEKMCEGVEKALVGKKLGSFTSQSAPLLPPPHPLARADGSAPRRQVGSQERAFAVHHSDPHAQVLNRHSPRDQAEARPRPRRLVLVLVHN